MEDSSIRMIFHPHYPPYIEYLHKHLLKQLDHAMHLPPSRNTICKWLYTVNETEYNNRGSVTDEHGTRLSRKLVNFQKYRKYRSSVGHCQKCNRKWAAWLRVFVRTAKYHEGEPKHKNIVIGESTYTAYDEADVWRVRETLWHLGFATAHNVKEQLWYDIHAVTDCHVENIEDQENCFPMYNY